MIRYLAAQGFEHSTVLQTADTDPSVLSSPDGYIDTDTYARVQNAAVILTGDDRFGFHMGQYADAGSWSILGYLMMNCRTLGEAFEKSRRYSRIIGNQIDARPRLYPGRACIVFSSNSGTASRHCYESALSSSVRIMRRLTGIRITPKLVTFSHTVAGGEAEYAEYFGCPVVFGEKDTSLTFDTGVARMPVLVPNEALRARFEEYAQEVLTAFAYRGKHTAMVRKLVVERMDDPRLSIRSIAREAAMSVRTLQARLREEGVVFRDLVRDVREELAKKHFRDGYSIDQTAYLLGYSEGSAFRKAFKKWTGTTPGDYREKCHATHGSRLA